MMQLFSPAEAVTMAAFNQRFSDIWSALPSQNLKIATGTYTGTGTSGAENANALSFNFAPILLLVFYAEPDRYGTLTITPNSACGNSFVGSVGGSRCWGYNNSVSFSNNGKSVSWYCADSFSGASPAWGQFNNANEGYQYVAVGF